MLLHKIAAGLDQGRIGRVAIIGEQEDVGLETTLLLDLERLRGQIPLLDRTRLGDEGGRIEVVGLDVLVLETVSEPHPGPECVDRAGADKSRIRRWKILPFIEADARMRHEDLRVFLEVGGHGDGRNVVLHRQEIADHVATMKNSILPAIKSMPPFDMGPPWRIVTSRSYLA